MKEDDDKDSAKLEADGALSLPVVAISIVSSSTRDTLLLGSEEAGVLIAVDTLPATAV